MHRIYTLTDMEREFQTDFAHVHHFINGYEGDARTNASQLAYCLNAEKRTRPGGRFSNWWNAHTYSGLCECIKMPRITGEWPR